MAKVLIVLAVGLMAAVVLLPGVRQGFTRILSNSETVVVPSEPDSGSGGDQTSGGDPALTASDENAAPEQELEIITLLGYDAIPSIQDPRFLTVEEANVQYSPKEKVLGLSINGEHRAYSVPMLSRHEIVNDVVGGVPVAITW